MSQSHLYLGQPIIDTAPRRVPVRLPIQVTVPLIAGLSLALWIGLWHVGSWGVELLRTLI